MKTNFFCQFAAAILFSQLVVYLASYLIEPTNILLIGVVIFALLFIVIKSGGKNARS